MRDNPELFKEAAHLLRTDTTITTFGTLARRMRHDYRSIVSLFEERGADKAIQTMFKRRKGKLLADKIWGLIEHYKTLSDGLGYAASEHDLKVAGGPTHKAYTHFFGSFRTIQILLDMKPNERGVHGHLVNRTIKAPRKGEIPLNNSESFGREGRMRQNAQGFHNLQRRNTA